MDTVLLIGKDEQVDDIVAIRERVVGAAADEDRGALVGELLDRVKLCQKHLLADRHVNVAGRVVAEGIGVHDKVVEEGTGGPLVVLFDHLLAEAGIARDLGDQFLVGGLLLSRIALQYHRRRRA